MAKTKKSKGDKTVKRGKKRDPLDNLTPFTSKNQPSPEAKRKGWELRRAKEAIIDSFARFTLAEYGDIAEIARKFKKGDYTDKEGSPLKVHEVKAIKYILNGKLDSDYMNRALEYAKQQIDVTSKGEQLQSEISKLESKTLDDEIE